MRVYVVLIGSKIMKASSGSMGVEFKHKNVT